MPFSPFPLLLSCGGAAAPLTVLVATQSTLVRREIAPAIGRLVSAQPPLCVVSPYAGGVRAGVSPALFPTNGPGPNESVRLAFLNPRRLDFLALGADVLLEWRLHFVAQLLTECPADVYVLPGARMPPGALLPEGFPFTWMGPRSVSWEAVYFNVRSEVALLLRPIPICLLTACNGLSVGATHPPAQAPLARVLSFARAARLRAETRRRGPAFYLPCRRCARVIRVRGY